MRGMDEMVKQEIEEQMYRDTVTERDNNSDTAIHRDAEKEREYQFNFQCIHAYIYDSK